MDYNRTALVTFLYPAAEKYLSELVADLNKQTDKNFTVIAFNDGVQKPEQWLNSLEIPYQVLSVKADTPMAIRFEALKLLRTENVSFDYLIFQDSDDGLSANRVEVTSNLLQDYQLVVNDLDIIDERGQILSTHIWKERFAKKSTFSSENLESYNFTGLGNTAIRTQLLESVPEQPRQELIAVDWFIFYSIMKKTAILGYRTSQCTTLYRQHSQNSIGQMTAEKYDLALKVRAKHAAALQAQNLNVPESLQSIYPEPNHPYDNPFWWELTQ